jgi:hypothetical protein
MVEVIMSSLIADVWFFGKNNFCISFFVAWQATGWSGRSAGATAVLHESISGSSFSSSFFVGATWISLPQPGQNL